MPLNLPLRHSIPAAVEEAEAVRVVVVDMAVVARAEAEAREVPGGRAVAVTVEAVREERAELAVLEAGTVEEELLAVGTAEEEQPVVMAEAV